MSDNAVVIKQTEDVIPAERRQRLAKVYSLLVSRARGSGWVRYGGVIPVEGVDGLRGVAVVEVNGQRGGVAVREVDKDNDVCQ